MKISFNWIQEYFDEKLNLNDLCEKLTMSGTKIETVESNKVELINVVTGLIEKIKPHPDAEKLVVCDVNIGDKNVQIVTGAKNMNEGDIVPVALHGAVLHGGLKIKKGKLRGVESQGMMCSEEELGLADCAEGLMIMSKDTPVGVNVLDVLDFGDDIIEFEITPNRPDCLGIMGILREIKALYKIDIKNKKNDFKVNKDKNINDMISIDVLNKKNCRRYSSRIIENVKICDSPQFIKERLIGAGINPINNIVDLANYVMLEIGQPMHVFDYEKISGKKIIVDNAKDNEKFLAIDGIERELNSSVLCTKDLEKTLAIAGIMGGENYKVQNDTKTIIIESANFDFDNIRRTSRSLNLRSESSGRFEKCIDDNLVLEALNRFCSLVDEFSYGDIVDGTIDIINDTYKPVCVEVSSQYINDLLKTSINENEITEIFTNLGMEVVKENSILKVIVPTFRRDIFIKQDLVEEVARIYGYDNIPSIKLNSEVYEIGKTRKQEFYDKLLTNMVSFGFSQAISYSFCGLKAFDKLCIEYDNYIGDSVNIKNPLSEEYKVMRTSMLLSILDVLCKNYFYLNEEVCIFDIGKTYFKNGESIEEKNVLAIGMYGKNFDYFSIKGVVESLFEVLKLDFILEREKEKFYHPGKSARAIIGNSVISKFGSVHPRVLSNYNVDTEFFVAEIDIDKIFKFYKENKKYKPIPKYPSVVFDLNVVADDNILTQDIEKIIKANSKGVLEKLEIFDVYTGSQISEGKRSISYRITFRDRQKTLNDVEINKIIQRILENLKNSLGAKLRQ